MNNIKTLQYLSSTIIFQKIILNNSVESLKRDLELISMLSGMEVQSYVANEHCCIVFHMQHDTRHEVKHGLKIDMNTGLCFSFCSLDCPSPVNVLFTFQKRNKIFLVFKPAKNIWFFLQKLINYQIVYKHHKKINLAYIDIQLPFFGRLV